ncbi:putative major facilitator superfamily transporter [Phaeomoniella chlamydospora]|uniref:Putative major facilitator superfamily transporter n=1 Tax=Phaeomoniella chlamydospora TaxID=158046 RepID=A0A0G2ERZ3_PHACM|nr:putative major facilitator superfamily transporter [Phaeomoniella chlamydospora]
MFPFKMSEGNPNDGPTPQPANPTSPCPCRDDTKGTQRYETKEQEADSAQESCYSLFTVTQKRWIVFLVAAAGMFSPMSSFIYYPAINSIASGLNTSVELINLTITSYMAVSGVVPTVVGNAADGLGRRPIYILTMLIYLVANIGLALQNSFPALLVLRMVQSAGSSGTISLGYGVISDITTPAERGSYVGLLLLGPNVAPPLGPIVGGVVSSKLGKLLDSDYASVARTHGLEVNRVFGDDLRNFPIEKARLRSVFYIIMGASLSILAYGWLLCFHVHFSAPLVMQFIIGATSTAIFTILGALLTDINSSASSTAAASANVIRCALAATGLAVVETMVQKIGPGWCFTIFSGITAAMGPLLLLERERGLGWRNKIYQGNGGSG